MGVRGEIFSKKLILPNRTYFFNVKENRMGDIYLNIVESKNRETGGFERQSIVLFAEDMQEFLTCFDESLHKVEDLVRKQRRENRNESAGRSIRQERDAYPSNDRKKTSERDDYTHERKKPSERDDYTHERKKPSERGAYAHERKKPSERGAYAYERKKPSERGAYTYERKKPSERGAYTYERKKASERGSFAAKGRKSSSTSESERPSGKRIVVKRNRD